jgi:hypothetical protein
MRLETGVRRFIFAWVALCGVILLAQRLHTPTQVSFEMAVDEAPPGIRNSMDPCLYWDTGQGFSSAQQICFDYQPRPLHQFQTYRIALATLRPIRRIRLDPLQQSGVVTLRNLIIGRYRFIDVDFEHELGHTIYPLNGVVLSREGQTLVAHLSTDDPYLMLSDRLDRLTGLEPEVVLQAAGLSLLICAGVVVGFSLLRKAGAGLRELTWHGPHS